MRFIAFLLAAFSLSACLPNAAGPMNAAREETSGSIVSPKDEESGPPPAGGDFAPPDATGAPPPPATTPPPPPEATEYFFIKDKSPIAAAEGIGPKPDNVNIEVVQLAWRTFYGEDLLKTMLQGAEGGEEILFVQATGPTLLAFRVQHRAPECTMKFDGSSWLPPESYEGSYDQWLSECQDKWVDASPGLKVRLFFEVAGTVQKPGEPNNRYCDTVVKTPFGRGPAPNVVVPNLSLKPGKLSLFVYNSPAAPFADCKNGWTKADASSFSIGEIDPETGVLLRKDVFLGSFALKYPLIIPKGGPITFE